MLLKHNRRWVVFMWLFLIGVLAYMDRTNFAISVKPIMKEFGIDAAQMGLIMSAFAFGYTILNFPGGFFAQKFGGRLSLTLIVLFWSIMTIATGFAWSFASLIVIRVLFGMGEGPHLPANARITDRWVRPQERGLASAIWCSALPLGIIVGQILCAWIATAWGWRATFTSLGFVGIIVAALTWVVVRDTPKEHTWVGEEELKLIEESQILTAKEQAKSGMTFNQIISNPWHWVITIIMFCIGASFWANISWLPTYFIQARGFNLQNAGFVASVPWVLCIVSPFVVGWVSDRIGKNKRTITLMMWLAIQVPFIAYGVYTPNIKWCLVSFCISLFFVWGAATLMWTIPFDVFSRTDGTKIAGMMITGGSIGGIFAPTMVGYMLKWTDSFDMVYYCLAGIEFFAFLLAIALFFKEKSVHRALDSKASVTP